ncbi:MAG: hypothetical protein ABIS84_11685 [Arachnia sp.]
MKFTFGVAAPLPIIGFRVEQGLSLRGVCLEPGDDGIGDWPSVDENPDVFVWNRTQVVGRSRVPKGQATRQQDVLMLLERRGGDRRVQKSQQPRPTLLSDPVEGIIGRPTDGDVVGVTADAVRPERDDDVWTLLVQEGGHLFDEPFMPNGCHHSVVVAEPDVPIRNPTNRTPRSLRLTTPMSTEV